MVVMPWLLRVQLEVLCWRFAVASKQTCRSSLSPEVEQRFNWHFVEQCLGMGEFLE